MNRLLLALLIAAFASWMPSHAQPAAAAPEGERDVIVIVDGQPVESASFDVRQGKVYVDAAAYVEQFGGTYEVRANTGNAVMNGVEMPTVWTNGRAYVHIRDVASIRRTETVEWDAAAGIVYVRSAAPRAVNVPLFAALFASCTVAAYSVMKKSTRRSALAGRVQTLMAEGIVKPAAQGGRPAKPKPALSPTRRWLAAAGAPLRRLPAARKHEKLLQQAGLTLRPEELFALRLFAAAAAAMLGTAPFGAPAAFAPLYGAAGFLAPLWYVRRKAARRMDRFGEQLPVAIGIMTTSIRAGFSFMQAMQLSGKEMSDPLGAEFTKTIQEIQFGVSFEEALRRMTDRVTDPNLGILVTALLVQHGTGGNLAQILDTIQETIEERARMKEEINTLTSQGKLSSIIITFLPIGLFFLLQLINPSYFEPMLSHPLGWFMLGIAAAMTLLGWLFIRKIVKIEV
ncbi:type II secretion system F family protein [Paenibacillus sp.]|uniref:type II secretion system F family protein n=1 Tax=Paenibacillus sp. TaxID=58172 RepID=UPI002D3464ED|nr:type II secretion system F family protein [Paenibacillus sp.]HZG85511.1 type II secretion system F family protein [Paenibacillus sp.]